MRAKRLAKTAVTAAFLVVMAIGSAISENAPASTPSEPADRPATAHGEPASVTLLNNHEVEGILGRQVLSAADENMGRIVDVIVDRSGRVRAAIIDFGGFLGVGSRQIAVDWNALSFTPEEDKRDIVTVELTRDQVKAAPEYKDKRAV